MDHHRQRNGETFSLVKRRQHCAGETCRGQQTATDRRWQQMIRPHRPPQTKLKVTQKHTALQLLLHAVSRLYHDLNDILRLSCSPPSPS